MLDLGTLRSSFRVYSIEDCRRYLRQICRTSADEHDIGPLMAEFVGGLGFDYACYAGPTSHDDAGFLRVVNSFPDKWSKRYREERYFVDSHVTVRAAMSSTPFFFSHLRDSCTLTGRARLKCLDARDHGVGDGLVVPVHEPSGRHGFFTVATRQEIEEIGPWMPVYQQVLTFATFSHAAGLASLNGGNLDRPIPHLTDQQRLCLHWTYEGKTAWEIAQIIGKSYATVIYHLGNASAKFGYGSKVRAAIQAKQMGLI